MPGAAQALHHPRCGNASLHSDSLGYLLQGADPVGALPVLSTASAVMGQRVMVLSERG